MKKLIILALLCAFLVSCGANWQYQIMRLDGQLVWADNGIKANFVKGDTVIIKTYPETGNTYIYGKYLGIVPPTRPNIYILYEKAVVIK